MKNTGDFSKILDTKLEFPKLKKLIYENGKIEESEFTIKQTMPNLEKLSIKFSPNFQIFIIEKILPKIKSPDIDIKGKNDEIIFSGIIVGKILLRSFISISFYLWY